MASKSSSFSFFSSLPTPVHLLYSAGLFFNHFAFVKQCSISRCSILNLILLLFSGHLLHGDLARPSGPGGHLRRQRGVHQPPGHLQQPGLPAGQLLGAALLQPLLQSPAGHFAASCADCTYPWSAAPLRRPSVAPLPRLHDERLWRRELGLELQRVDSGEADVVRREAVRLGHQRTAHHLRRGIDSRAALRCPIRLRDQWRGGRRDEEAVADGALRRLGGHFVDW